jgi:hypothetical protein
VKTEADGLLAARFKATVVGEDDSSDWNDVLRRWQPKRSNRRRRVPRRSLVLAALAVLVLSLVGAGYGLGLSFWDQYGDPNSQRVGERVEVAAEDGWSLQAWRTTRGICLGLSVDEEPRFSGCGMPVVGAPEDTVFAQPPPTHLIGYLAGYTGEDSPRLFVTGPLSPSVAGVEVELTDGRRFEARVFHAPEELESSLRFYLVEPSDPPEAGPGRPPVRALRAYDAAGVRLEQWLLKEWPTNAG